MTALHDHEPTQFYWSADSEYCPHGPQPDYRTDGEAWDIWRERHPSSDDGPVCLDAPADLACPACSAEHGDMVPWSRCDNRDHTRARQATAEPQHRPVTADVGDLECWEQECEDYFTDDGEEIPGKTSCSHLRQMEICEACSEAPTGDDYPAVVAWVDCPHAKAEAVSR